jgi:hypothetical protein
VLADSTTTLTSSESSLNQGESVALTATVVPQYPYYTSEPPAGVVKFYAGPDNLYLGSAPLTVENGEGYYASATATLDTTEIPAGTDEAISAVYQGDNDPAMPDSSTAADFYAASTGPNSRAGNKSAAN